MHMFFYVGDFKIPVYGLMIVLGVVIANLIAWYMLLKYQLDGNDFLILEGYIFLGAIIGSKGLYLWVSRDVIQWTRLLELEYFNTLMKGGFVFYGGIIGGILSMILGAKIHHISGKQYIQKLIFLIPLTHGFGRIGCFFAGCCYGTEYDGIFSVVFPENSMAPSGIPLFPVQLVEAIGLFILALITFFFCKKATSWRGLEIYLIGYGIFRFGLEFFRNDLERGFWGSLSTSQWISIFLVIGCLAWMKLKKKAES